MGKEHVGLHMPTHSDLNYCISDFSLRRWNSNRMENGFNYSAWWRTYFPHVEKTLATNDINEKHLLGQKRVNLTSILGYDGSSYELNTPNASALNAVAEETVCLSKHICWLVTQFRKVRNQKYLWNGGVLRKSIKTCVIVTGSDSPLC